MADRLPVTRITLPTPYGVGPVNAYLIDGDPTTLVDTGMNLRDSSDTLTRALEEAGRPIETVQRILITHAHPDHYGLVHFIGERSGATVYFPEWEIARVRDPNMLIAAGRLLMEAGMPLELLFQMDEQRRKEPRSKIKHEEVSLARDGDVFEFEQGFRLECLHSPGHSGGHVIYLERATGTLFAGDQLLPDVSPNPLLEPSVEDPTERRHSLKEYLLSLETMAALDLSIAYPGHGDPIADPRSLIEQTIEHHHKRKAAIAAHLTDEPKSPYQIAQEFYPDAVGYDIFLSVSEVVAHLDLVIDEGLGRVEEREGITLYRAGV